MALVCKIVTDWVEKEVVEPVEHFIDQLQEECQQYPWYDPRGWVCWFIVVSVKVVDYIVTTITIPVSKAVCYVMAVCSYYPLVPLAFVIDEVTQTTEVYVTLKTWMLTCSEAVLTDKLTTAKKGVYNYDYTCKCCNGFKDTGVEYKISFLAEDDADAYKYARKQCAQKCTDL